MRKIVSLLMVVIVLGTVSFSPVLAAEKTPEISVMSLMDGNCSLVISGMTAKSGVTVRASDTDSISITLSLQKLKDGTWTDVKSTSDSTTNDSLSMTMTKLITAGSFRTKAVVTVKDGTTTETKTYYSSVEVKE